MRAALWNNLVGLAGLEPATFRPPDGRATRLRHSPTGALFSETGGWGKRNTPDLPGVTQLIAQLGQLRSERGNLFGLTLQFPRISGP